MADHVRKRIRAAAVADLTGLATTGPRVRGSAIWPLARDSAPTLLVYTPEEEAEYVAQGSGGTRRQLRTVTLMVEGVAEGTEADLDDTLDAIGKEVETALVAAMVSGTSQLGPLVHDLRFERAELGFDDGGRKPAGSIAMRFQVDWTGLENDPTATV